MLKELRLTTKDLKRKLTIYHGFTRYRVQLDVYETKEKQNQRVPDTTNSGAWHHHRWVSVSDLKKFAFPAPHQKIVRELVKKND